MSGWNSRGEQATSAAISVPEMPETPPQLCLPPSVTERKLALRRGISGEKAGEPSGKGGNRVSRDGYSTRGSSRQALPPGTVEAQAASTQPSARRIPVDRYSHPVIVVLTDGTARLYDNVAGSLLVANVLRDFPRHHLALSTFAPIPLPSTRPLRRGVTYHLIDAPRKADDGGASAVNERNARLFKGFIRSSSAPSDRTCATGDNPRSSGDYATSISRAATTSSAVTVGSAPISGRSGAEVPPRPARPRSYDAIPIAPVILESTQKARRRSFDTIPIAPVILDFGQSQEDETPDLRRTSTVRNGSRTSHSPSEDELSVERTKGKDNSNARSTFSRFATLNSRPEPPAERFAQKMVRARTYSGSNRRSRRTASEIPNMDTGSPGVQF
ncbi:hypothetical protein CLOP_g8617 [Closterium sp. NIES-67]|nr:hypothetical protein CLOP_g8617 [Closterium sp. NIES-67]